MPNTWGIEYGLIEMDLTEGFPLLTTKEMFWKGIVHELLWFLRGETNIKYLVDNKVNIWNGDAYRWYLKKYHERAEGEELTMEGFIDLIKNPRCNDKAELPYWTENNGQRYTLGDLGKVYGYQWRNQNGVDQIKDIVEGLKTSPYSRYHILDGWNKADFRDMALPPCHLLYQFIVRPLTLEERVKIYGIDILNVTDAGFYSNTDAKIRMDIANVPRFYLNLNMYQRSCDTFLGVPFNIASMSLLLMIMAKSANMIPLKSRWIGGDVHLYMDHIPVVKDQIARNPKTLPQMNIKKDIITLDDIMALTIDDFELVNYQSYDKLKGELFTGNKKK
jgi:thymidylate synthase